MATAMVQAPTAPSKPRYNPGTPGTIERVGPGLFLVSSWRRPETIYSVNLKAGTCTCPHFQQRLKDEGQECKHLTQCRKEQAERYRLVAGSLCDQDLDRARRVLEDAGRFDAAFACLAEQFDRQALR